MSTTLDKYLSDLIEIRNLEKKSRDPVSNANIVQGESQTAMNVNAWLRFSQCSTWTLSSIYAE